jgi:hypothetical protein
LTRKAASAVLLAALVLPGLVSSCSAPPPPERDPFGSTLAAAVARAYRQHVDLKLDAVTPFQWDRFFAFKPNQSPEQIDAALGFHWAKNYSDQTNTYCLLVFVTGARVTHSLLYPRYQGDCLQIGTGPYDPPHAVFSVTSSSTTTGGQPFLRLFEAS